MRYGSVSSGIECAAIACTKCGGTREEDKLRRDTLRKHGHPDWCRKCYARLAQKIRNSRVAPDRRRQWNRTTRYKLTNADVEQMIASQNGNCAICEEVLPPRYHIDHCHTTGNVRGILCHGCNLKLPIVERPKLLASAIAYLARSKL